MLRHREKPNPKNNPKATRRTTAKPQTTDHNTANKTRICWAEAPIKIARMTLTIKLDRNWSSFQLANSAPTASSHFRNEKQIKRTTF